MWHRGKKCGGWSTILSNQPRRTRAVTWMRPLLRRPSPSTASPSCCALQLGSPAGESSRGSAARLVAELRQGPAAGELPPARSRCSGQVQARARASSRRRGRGPAARDGRGQALTGELRQGPGAGELPLARPRCSGQVRAWARQSSRRHGRGAPARGGVGAAELLRPGAGTGADELSRRGRAALSRCGDGRGRDPAGAVEVLRRGGVRAPADAVVMLRPEAGAGELPPMRSRCSGQGRAWCPRTRVAR